MKPFKDDWTNWKIQQQSGPRPSGDDMGTSIAKTILKIFAAAVAISAALLAAAWLLSQKP